jgi:hypothetical protein
MALPSSSGDLLWCVRSIELASIGGPIEASSIDPTHQSRSSEDEGRAIPGNVVVYKQGDDGESPKLKKKNVIQH